MLLSSHPPGASGSVCRHGYGILKDGNGEIYNGDWEFDVYNGQGRLRNKYCEQLSEEFDYNNFDKLKNFWVSYSGEFKNHSLHVIGHAGHLACFYLACTMRPLFLGS